MSDTRTKIKIWIDEAGRGPWAWPVVACALGFHPNNPPKNLLKELTDSKKLSAKKREELYEKLIQLSLFRHCEERNDEAVWKNWKIASSSIDSSQWHKLLSPQVFFGVGVVDNYAIDQINIRQANKEAMRRALVEIQRKISGFELASVVIDGRDNYEFEELEKNPLYIVWWDAKVKEIGAASIIAKVFRDKLMQQYATLYPHLWFETGAGYGVKKHREQLQNPQDITGIHRTTYKPVKEVLEKKEKLLLHICCGPDATVPIMDLKDRYEVICFWYDPNIQPKREYDTRLEAFKKVCQIEEVEWIEWEYDVKNFFKRIKWLEHTPEKWEKCTECYDMRLERTAKLAEEMWIKYWTSTLNTSPHKDLEKMFALGDKHSLKENLEFLKIAFRKNGGFQRSVDYTKKHNIYRQDYCGCVYSDTFPGNKRKGARKWFSW